MNKVSLHIAQKTVTFCEKEPGIFEVEVEGCDGMWYWVGRWDAWEGMSPYFLRVLRDDNRPVQEGRIAHWYDVRHCLILGKQEQIKEMKRRGRSGSPAALAKELKAAILIEEDPLSIQLVKNWQIFTGTAQAKRDKVVEEELRQATLTRQPMRLRMPEVKEENDRCVVRGS